MNYLITTIIITIAPPTFLTHVTQIAVIPFSQTQFIRSQTINCRQIHHLVHTKHCNDQRGPSTLRACHIPLALARFFFVFCIPPVMHSSRLRVCTEWTTEQMAPRLRNGWGHTSCTKWRKNACMSHRAPHIEYISIPSTSDLLALGYSAYRAHSGHRTSKWISFCLSPVSGHIRRTARLGTLVWCLRDGALSKTRIVFTIMRIRRIVGLIALPRLIACDCLMP